MTKVLFSGIVSDMRGKHGGSVFSKSSSGNTMRIKSGVRNPQTEAQLRIRRAFTFISSSWRGLSIQQIEQWNIAAAAVRRTNSMGVAYYMSGKAYFQHISSIALLLGLPLPTVPPSPGAYKSPVPTVVDDNVAGTATLSLSRAMVEGEYIIFKGTGYLSRGVSNVHKKPHKIINIWDYTIETPINIQPFITNTFPAPPVGMNPLFGKIFSFVQYSSGHGLTGEESWALAEDYYDWNW